MMSERKQLDLSPLHQALLTLGEAVSERKKEPSNNFVRYAMILRFEYTYELAHKMLKAI